MIAKGKIVNREAAIKIAGLDHSKVLNIKDWTDAGLWVQSETLHGELAKLAKDEGVPGFLKRNPLVFLPFSRIEWVMVAALPLLQSTNEPAPRRRT